METAEPKYVLKLDGNYYAGPNKKHTDMFNISGSGALGAKQMSLEDVTRLSVYFTKNGLDTEIEKYDAKQYLTKTLERILVYEHDRQHGKDVGYAIENLTKNCLGFVKQIP